MILRCNGTPRARKAPFALALAAAFSTHSTSHAQASLPETVVSASRQEQAAQTAPVGATVLLGEDIRASGVLDANEAVRKLAGVPSRSGTGGREYTLDLRGHGEAAQQNLVVVIDGVRITENELANARLSAISPDMIERIEIVRGGASVMWGEGASGGVIQVVTRRGNKAGGLHGSAQVGVESWGTRDARASVEVGGPKLAMDARLRDWRSEGYRANSAQHQQVAALALRGEGGPLRWRIGAHHESDLSRFPGSLSAALAAANPRQTTTPADFGDLRENRLSASVDWRSGPWTVALDLAARDRRSDANFVGFGFISNAASTQHQVSPRVTYAGEFAGLGVNAVLGHDSLGWDANYRSNFGQDEDAAQRNSGWYGKLDLLLPSQTRLSAGARRETVRKSALDPANFVNYTNDYALTAWEFAASQTLATGWDLYARTAKSFRMGNVDENRFTAGPLRPMLAWDREIGLKYLAGTTSASVRLFSQRSVDEIAFDPVFFININQDAIRRQGLELDGRTRLGGRWDIAGSLQLIQARFTGGPNTGRTVPLVARTTASVRLGYAIDEAHRVEVSTQHRGEAFVGGDNANACARVPSATVLDAHYRYSRLTGGKGWTLAAGVDNLTDLHTWSNAFSAGCGFIGVYPEPGRTLRLNARYAF
ncbi:MAG: TonB-dependent receptor [Ramlibacter sp.]|jgi:iron complex outermembrane receptor protein|nr:TonB-dependent receptor [Ramlibacter sp.]